MNILHPTTGQLIDRMTILDLKISAGAIHHKVEWAEIRARLGTGQWPETVSAIWNELEEVNRQLWDCNILIASAPQHIVTAKEVWTLNNKRMALIEEIDKLTGEYTGPEKI